MTKEIKEYVKTLEQNTDLDNYIMFSYKRDYIENIMSIMYKDVKCKIDYGYGNYNSSICFLFEDKKKEDEIKSNLMEILDNLCIDYYSIYSTYINKVNKLYVRNNELLTNELSCIKPNIIFYFGNPNLIHDLLSYKGIDLRDKIYIINDFNSKDFIKLIKEKNILRR
jgi:hypothetical protein